MGVSFKAIATALVATAATTVPASAAQELWVAVDQARPLKLKRAAASLIVGNPSIADISIHDDQTLFILGKSQGVTNLFIMDNEGETIENLTITVTMPRGQFLTLNKGGDQYSFTCTHRCEQTPAVGDSQDAFQLVTGQIQSKTRSALEAARVASEAAAADDS
ncbi:MAG: pilus assembly protein N-terminal domain-containing protein [Pseudomonadota bacterium]